jgi:hypothetical protein
MRMVADTNTSERMRLQREREAARNRIVVAPKADAVDVDKSSWVQRYRAQRDAETDVGAGNRHDRRVRMGLATPQEQQRYRDKIDAGAEADAAASIDELLGGGAPRIDSGSRQAHGKYGHQQQRPRARGHGQAAGRTGRARKPRA